MRIMVTGSRNWTDAHTMFFAFADADVDHADVLVHGDCEGADRMAARLAKARGARIEAHPADWRTHGRAAGPIRNAAMLATGIDLVLAFPMSGSVGTWDAIRKAVEMGVRVNVYPTRKVGGSR